MNKKSLISLAFITGALALTTFACNVSNIVPIPVNNTAQNITTYSTGNETTPFEVRTLRLQGAMGKFGDHTYVNVPEKNAVFNCWGRSAGGQKVLSANGIYNVAECYRVPVADNASVLDRYAKDTAGIGKYAKNGVCHQTANLFLYSSGKALTTKDGVRGYWVSVSAFGIYGVKTPVVTSSAAFLNDWLLKWYKPCAGKYAIDAGDTTFQDIQDIRGKTTDEDDLLYKESMLLAKQVVPDMPDIRDIQKQLLQKKNRAISSSLKGKSYADEINSSIVEFEKALLAKVGSANYEKLTGFKANETFNIVDPEIAEATAE